MRSELKEAEPVSPKALVFPSTSHRPAFLDIRTITDTEYLSTRRKYWQQDHSEQEHWELLRYQFDVEVWEADVPQPHLVNHRLSSEEKSEAFKWVHHNSRYYDRYVMSFYEMNTSPEQLVVSNLQTGKVMNMMRKRGLHLSIVRQICDILSFSSTHDTETVVSRQLLLDNQAQLQCHLEHLASVKFMVPREQKVTVTGNAQATDVKLAKAIGKVFHSISGHKLNTFGKRRDITVTSSDGTVKRAKIFDQFKLELDTKEYGGMPAVLKALVPSDSSYIDFLSESDVDFL